DQEVPGVGIAVEEAVLEEHAAVEGAHPARDLGEPVTRGTQLAGAGDLDALEVLHHDHAIACVLLVDARDADAIDRKNASQTRGRLRLAAEIELHRDEASHLDGEALEIDHRLHALDEARDPTREKEVERKDAADLGVLDLDHDIGAVAESSAVDLGERRRAEE